MGEARRRGSFEVRKSQAIEASRIPEVRRKLQAQARINRVEAKAAYLDYIRNVLAAENGASQYERT